jgi:hypothetical protein
LAMMQIDQTITFTGAVITLNNGGLSEHATIKQSDLPKPPPAPPSITNPSKGSIGAFIASIFAAIFKRK